MLKTKRNCFLFVFQLTGMKTLFINNDSEIKGFREGSIYIDPNKNVHEMTSLSNHNLEGLISTPLKSEEIRGSSENKLMN